MSHTPSAQPPSPHSMEPAQAWAEAQTGGGGGSVAGSVRSVISENGRRRREAAEARFAAENEERYQEWLRQEDAKFQEIVQELEEEDRRLEAAVIPVGRGVGGTEEHLGVLKRERQVLSKQAEQVAHRARTVNGLIDHLSTQGGDRETSRMDAKPHAKQFSQVPLSHSYPSQTPAVKTTPPPEVFLSANHRLPETTPCPAVIHSLIYTDIADKKPTRPDKWTGVRDRAKLEEWMVGVHSYLAAVKFSLDAPLSREFTPVVWGVLLNSFSKDALSGHQISPREWFISADTSSPFPSVRSLLQAVESNWYDHSAAETALNRFHSAKQHRGSAARDFAGTIDSLGRACFDRVISDQEKAYRFLQGVLPEAAYFIRQTLAMRGRQPFDTPFRELMDIAAAYDSLPTSHVLSTSTGSTVSKSRPTSTTTVVKEVVKSSSGGGGYSQTSPSTSHSVWIARAAEYQKNNPLDKKSTWHSPDSCPPPKPIACYNCCRVGSHYSTSCPNPRVAPRAPILARFQTVAPSPVVESGTSAPTLAPNERSSDVDLESSGKADDEQELVDLTRRMMLYLLPLPASMMKGLCLSVRTPRAHAEKYSQYISLRAVPFPCRTSFDRGCNFEVLVRCLGRVSTSRLSRYYLVDRIRFRCRP